jgi:hypothetical protein
LPDALKPLFKDGHCELGKWYKATLEEANLENIPADIKELFMDKSSWFGVTKVT